MTEVSSLSSNQAHEVDILFLALDNYTKLCSIEVDLNHLRYMADQFKKIGPEGAYYRFHYKLILLFGLSELKAVFSWKENVSRLFIAWAN